VGSSTHIQISKLGRPWLSYQKIYKVEKFSWLLLLLAEQNFKSIAFAYLKLQIVEVGKLHVCRRHNLIIYYIPHHCQYRAKDDAINIGTWNQSSYPWQDIVIKFHDFNVGYEKFHQILLIFACSISSSLYPQG